MSVKMLLEMSAKKGTSDSLTVRKKLLRLIKGNPSITGQHIFPVHVLKTNCKKR